MNLPDRKSARLQGHGYRDPKAYFVTICTHLRLSLFGSIEKGESILSPAGEIASACWHSIPDFYPTVTLDLFVVMPNHIHGILFLGDTTSEKPPLLGRVIGATKAAATTRIRQLEEDPGYAVWQRRYYDHVIRSQRTLEFIRTHIAQNPLRWGEDECFV